MCFDMCPEANAQFLRCLQHELAVTPHDCSIDHDSRCLDIFNLAAEEVVFESCLRGLWDERWCMERRRRVRSSHSNSIVSVSQIGLYNNGVQISRFVRLSGISSWYISTSKLGGEEERERTM